MTTETTAPAGETQNGNKQPNYYAKIRHGFGKKASYERIGAGWKQEDGSIYVKLVGTQIVSDGFMLYAAEDNAKAGA